MNESEITYGDPKAGPTVRGTHHPIVAYSRAEFDEKITELMALPGYKVWRRSPMKGTENSFEPDQLEQKRRTVWSARLMIFEKPVEMPEAVWPPESKDLSSKGVEN